MRGTEGVLRAFEGCVCDDYYGVVHSTMLWWYCENVKRRG